MASTVSIAKREEQALNRLQQTAKQLMEAWYMPAMDVAPTHKAAPLRHVVRLEAMAEFLECLAIVAKPVDPDALQAEWLAMLEAADGIGDATMAKIRTALGLEDDGNSD